MTDGLVAPYIHKNATMSTVFLLKSISTIIATSKQVAARFEGLSDNYSKTVLISTHMDTVGQYIESRSYICVSFLFHSRPNKVNRPFHLRCIYTAGFFQRSLAEIYGEDRGP